MTTNSHVGNLWEKEYKENLPSQGNISYCGKELTGAISERWHYHYFSHPCHMSILAKVRCLEVGLALGRNGIALKMDKFCHRSNILIQFCSSATVTRMRRK